MLFGCLCCNVVTLVTSQRVDPTNAKPSMTSHELPIKAPSRGRISTLETRHVRSEIDGNPTFNRIRTPA
jgi:hypothetical protein